MADASKPVRQIQALGQRMNPGGMGKQGTATPPKMKPALHRTVQKPSPTLQPYQATQRSAQAVIQRVWLYYDGMSLSDKVVFWLNEGDGDKPDGPPPTAWKGIKVVDASEVPPYYRPSLVKRPPRGKLAALSLAEYTSQYGKVSTASKEVYNPFGRFDSGATCTSFFPSSEFPEDRYQEMVKHLQEKDSTYDEWDPSGTKKLLEFIKSKEKEKGADVRVHNDWNYPVAIYTKGGKVLVYLSHSAFGAVYSDKLPVKSRAKNDPLKVDDPSKLKWSKDVKKEKEVKSVTNSGITKDQVDSWSGKKREIDQSVVMGMSAGEAAANAGFDPKEGKGWEWLHLIAHSMGGVELKGPQISGNLVAGTSECNTQMIVVEEFLKDVVQKTSGKAKLSVMAKLLDEERHIGEFIQYDFVMYGKDGTPLAVYTWRFDCLSRTQPLVVENRNLRYSGQSVYGFSKEDKSGSKGYSFGKEYDFGSKDGKDKEKHEKAPYLSVKELASLVRSMSKERLAEVGYALGLKPSQHNIQDVFDALRSLGEVGLIDIAKGTSLDIKPTKEITSRIDQQLEEYGMIRKPSDTVGFICLIDSIFQLLASQGINIDRDLLIQQVRLRTGRMEGQMLEIIGDEGTNVMRAVDEVVFNATGRHIRLHAHVYMVMPGGNVVPFYNANRYDPGSGDTVDLELLFVNNNHYEPIFMMD